MPGVVRNRLDTLLRNGRAAGTAVSQPGGYSPGSADRVRTVSGRRAFVKSAGLVVNPDTPRIYRAEAAVTAALPATVPAPALLGLAEHEDWIALVLEDVEARHPSTPWQPRELAAVLDALHEVGSVRLPLDASVAELPDAVAGYVGRWRAIDPVALPPLPGGLGDWVRRQIEH